MMRSKAMILGAAGLVLTEAERAFYIEHKPWGFILFARNIASAEQVLALVGAMRDCVGRDDAPVFIDQEGGRVQRIRPPMAPNYPAAARMGALYATRPEEARRAAWLLGRLHAFDLLSLGIDANCMPVLDVPVEGAHDVIGNRAYGRDPDQVAVLGAASAEGLLAGGVLPVIKHIPGHGRAGADSHKELPSVSAPIEELRGGDFRPFAALKDLPMAMSAHVVYTAIDSDHPATTSRRLIEEIIRGEIGFDGLLMSDDVSMHALSGDFGDRVKAIIAAGCDMVLHCNGDMAEMTAVAQAAPVLSGDAARRADAALAARRAPDGLDENAMRAEFAALMPVEA